MIIETRNYLALDAMRHYQAVCSDRRRLCISVEIFFCKMSTFLSPGGIYIRRCRRSDPGGFFLLHPWSDSVLCEDLWYFLVLVVLSGVNDFTYY